MDITVFTSNQPRHLRLIAELAKIADNVFAVIESTTVFPGQIADFYAKSETMQAYFVNVIAAEKELFGGIHFLPSNVRTLTLKTGDLSGVPLEILAAALKSDAYVVFGASYIRGELADMLQELGAINIHMGLSPYYRGSSCNFWAMYDEKPGYVGATLHLLTTGLDSGPMIRHIRPRYEGENGFLFTMKAVQAAQDQLIRLLAENKLRSLPAYEQNKSLQVRYTRNQDFDDSVAKEFLSRHYSEGEFVELLERSRPANLLED